VIIGANAAPVIARGSEVRERVSGFLRYQLGGLGQAHGLEFGNNSHAVRIAFVNLEFCQ
jgi:hypothetical protein